MAADLETSIKNDLLTQTEYNEKLQEMMVNQEAVEITKERVYELMEWLK